MLIDKFEEDVGYILVVLGNLVVGFEVFLGNIVVKVIVDVRCLCRWFS